MNKMPQEKKLSGPILALDLGQKRIGVAVADELLISITRLNSLRRSSWKQLLQDVCFLVRRFDAQILVIGLPLRLNGTSGSAALDVWRTAKKFALSLQIPVFLQDERLTSAEAVQHLRAEGRKPREISALVDSESAAIILRDFIPGGQERILVRA